MLTPFPAGDALCASQTRIHFNLGTIGRLESSRVGPQGPRASSNKYFYGALVHTNPGMPRPDRDLDAALLRASEGMPLALLAARHHGRAYYVICDLQDRNVRAALQFACDLGRMEMGFVPEAGPPLWSAMCLEEPVVARLREQLALYKPRRGPPDEWWRDRLGLLLLGLPTLLSEADPEAALCTVHSAMLLSGNPAHVNGSFR